MKGSTRWTVLALLLLAGLAEGIGLTSLLPALSLAGSPETARSSHVSRLVLDALDKVGLPANLETLMLIVVAGIGLKGALRILAMRHVGYAAAEVATRLRRSLIDNLLQVKWSYFTRQPVGRIANAISLEATRSARAYVLSVQVIATTIQSAVYIGVALLLSWTLALLALAIGGTIAFILGSLVTKAKRAGRRQTKHTKELVAHLSDALIGIKPLKAMARQAHFAQLFSDRIDDLRRALRKQVLNKELLASLQEPMLTLCLAAGFYLAVKFWSMEITELIVMGILLQRSVTRIGKVQKMLQEGVILESAYWSIHDLVKESKREREPSHGTLKPTLEQGIEIKNVTFSYGGAPVLQNISMDIRARQLTVLIGASGAGKTTLTDLVLGLHLPDRGQILIDGQSLDQVDLQAWRSMVGYVPQEQMLFHDTVLANVTLGDASLSGEQARSALEKAGAWSFVSALPDGIMTVVGERGSALSGGQRQRIALARALVHKPSLLILDEVTSGLDAETEAEICQNMREISTSLTIIALSHRSAWVDAADQVYDLSAEDFGLVPEQEPELSSL
ncbi:MAG: ABC transporter ATP-binding protein/permease [Rhodospirillales bacterium]|nr:ABC transporter ATP-binding protein/permease [Rhodospirillales bacterium]